MLEIKRVRPGFAQGYQNISKGRFCTTEAQERRKEYNELFPQQKSYHEQVMEEAINGK